MERVNFAHALLPYWKKGHWFFEIPPGRSEIHTDLRLDIESVSKDIRLRELIIEGLADLMLEANPDYLVDCRGWTFHWASSIAYKLTEKLGHQVYILDRWDESLASYKKVPGRALIFVDIFVLGIEPEWSLEKILEAEVLEPTALVTIVDRSPGGTFRWHTGNATYPELNVGALVRQSANVYLARDCPECKQGRKFTANPCIMPG